MLQRAAQFHEAPPSLPPSGPSSPSRPNRSAQASRSIVEPPKSTDIFRGPSPAKRLHHPSRWSEWPGAAALSSARASSRRVREDPVSESSQPKLLEAMGLSPLTLDPEDTRRTQALPPPRLPDDAPENLQHCGDHCYWRWLVHTLIPELTALRQSLKETEEEFHERALERREIENIIGYRDYILDDLTSRKEALRKLREEVPRLRREHERLHGQSGHLEGRRQAAKAKQVELNAEIKKSVELQIVMKRQGAYIEQECEQTVQHEQMVQKKIAKDTEEMQELAEELKRSTMLRDHLRTEVTLLEEAKKNKKKSKVAK